MSTPLTIFAGTANQDLASRTVQNLGIHLGECRIESFPDGELQVELNESVRGHDVYLLQSTSPPADKHLLELALLADACHRAGAGRVTALVPYFGYARQDRCTSPGQALGARVLTDLLQACPIERLVTIDLHTAAIEGFFSIAVEHLSAVPLLAEAARPFVEGPSIVVAPDLGAVKLAKQYAQYLELPLAIVHKIRQSGENVDCATSRGRREGSRAGDRGRHAEHRWNRGGLDERAAGGRLHAARDRRREPWLVRRTGRTRPTSPTHPTHSHDRQRRRATFSPAG